MKIYKLKKGDDLIRSLEEFVLDKPSGLLVGLGALESVIIKIFDHENKEYSEKAFDGPLELCSFTAVVSINPDGKMGIHPHAVFSDKNFNAYGGHLSSAIVGPTFEFVFFNSKNEARRYFDKEIGLNLIK